MPSFIDIFESFDLEDIPFTEIYTGKHMGSVHPHTFEALETPESDEEDAEELRDDSSSVYSDIATITQDDEVETLTEEFESFLDFSDEEDEEPTDPHSFQPIEVCYELACFKHHMDHIHESLYADEVVFLGCDCESSSKRRIVGSKVQFDVTVEVMICSTQELENYSLECEERKNPKSVLKRRHNYYYDIEKAGVRIADRKTVEQLERELDEQEGALQINAQSFDEESSEEQLLCGFTNQEIRDRQLQVSTEDRPEGNFTLNRSLFFESTQQITPNSHIGAIMESQLETPKGPVRNKQQVMANTGMGIIQEETEEEDID